MKLSNPKIKFPFAGKALISRHSEQRYEVSVSAVRFGSGISALRCWAGPGLDHPGSPFDSGDLILCDTPVGEARGKPVWGLDEPC